MEPQKKPSVAWIQITFYINFKFFEDAVSERESVCEKNKS